MLIIKILLKLSQINQKLKIKNTDNTNSNKAKADNKSIKKNISNNENNQNIQKFEKAKIIGDDLFEKKENMKIYKYPKKESSFKTGIAMKAKKTLFLGNAQESFIEHL